MSASNERLVYLPSIGDCLNGPVSGEQKTRGEVDC
jgi:hypothetical protein